MNKQDIPRVEKIKSRVNVFKVYNEYTREAIDYMKKSIDKKEIYYISFKDSNTKELSTGK